MWSASDDARGCRPVGCAMRPWRCTTPARLPAACVRRARASSTMPGPGIPSSIRSSTPSSRDTPAVGPTWMSSRRCVRPTTARRNVPAGGCRRPRMGCDGGDIPRPGSRRPPDRRPGTPGPAVMATIRRARCAPGVSATAPTSPANVDRPGMPAAPRRVPAPHPSGAGDRPSRGPSHIPSRILGWANLGSTPDVDRVEAYDGDSDLTVSSRRRMPPAPSCCARARAASSSAPPSSARPSARSASARRASA